MALQDFLTGSDLLLATLDAAGQNPASTDDYATTAKAAIHEAYWQILGWKPWPFAKAKTPGILSTAAKIAPTVSSISGTTVTLSATIATSQAGKKWFLDSNQAVYRISAHTAGTNSLTLDATYVEDETSGLSTIYQDEYSLATDCIVPYGPFWLRGQFEGEVELMNEHEFRDRYGKNSSNFGLTEAVGLIRYALTDADQAPVVQVAPWTEQAVNLEYEYAQRHVLTFDDVAATDTPRVPREYRSVIKEWALWLLFRKKSDDAIVPTTENVQSILNLMEARYLNFSNRARAYTRPRHSLGGTRCR